MYKGWLKIAFLVGFACVLTINLALCQGLSVNTDEMESLIDEWNFANNTRNLHSFSKVYGDHLVFYSEKMSKSRAIALKQQLFSKKPWFRQRITTEITYTPFSTGVVKAEFTKEVFEKTEWKKYPSYLLVSYHNNRYSIVGESDVPTDRKLRYKEKLGEPISFRKKEQRVPDRASKDSTLAINIPARSPDGEAANKKAAGSNLAMTKIKGSDLDHIVKELASPGVITIPKGYVFVLIGLLCLGGIMIFIADSVQSRRRKMRNNLQPHMQAEPVVRDFKIQSAFEAFVMTLFDPLYFRPLRAKAEHVYAGRNIPPEEGPHLMFDFRQNDTHVRFAITCQYYQHSPKNEVQLLSYERQQLFRRFETERGIEVYYILGFAGTPDDPRELFFLPAKEVKSEYMTRTQLKQYSKSGMFYYNRRTGRIR